MKYEDKVTMKGFTDAELEKFWVAAQASGLRNYALCAVCYFHGMRSVEICRLEMRDIDMKARTINVRRVKRSADNVQPLQPREYDALAAWLEQRGNNPSPYVFVSRSSTDGRLDKSQFFRIFKAIATASGAPEHKRHGHVLKHSIATRLARAGMPIPDLQRYMGWRSKRMVLEYLSADDATANESASKILATA